MIQTSIPEIDVAELMQRVRAEAAKIAERRASETGTSPAPVLPMLRILAPPPAPASIRPVNFKRERFDDLLRRANDSNKVAGWIPKFLRGLFRNQGGFNHELLEAVTSLVKVNHEMSNRVRELGGAVEAQSRWLNVLADRRVAENTWMRAVQRRLGIDGGAAAENDPIAALEGEIARLENEVNAVRASVTSPEHLRSTVEQLGSQLNRLEVEVREAKAEARLAQRSLEQLASKRSELEQQRGRLEERLPRG